MIRKIVLVRPGDYPEGLIAPLGIMYIASYLRSKLPDIEVLLIDAPLEDLTAVQVAERVKAFGPDLVGLSGLTYHVLQMKAAAQEIHRLCPEALIVAGGPGVSSDPADFFKEPSIKYGIMGEGEETFYQLVKCLREGKNPETLDGLAYLAPDGKTICNPSRGQLEPDSIPYPAFDLIPVFDYFSSKKRTSQSPVYISKRILPILTSRGCPMKCVFCHDTLGKVFRCRSVDNVMQEILMLKSKYGIEELEIIDDIFNFDIKRAKEIFRKLINAALNLKISFPNGIKYEMIDDELMGLFKKAGVYRVAFGIESASAEGQKLVRKRTNLVRMSEIINQAHDMGFFVSGFFQIGLPGETKAQMLETINYAISSKLHTAMFHVTTPFPGTPMYEEHIESVVKDGNNGSREQYEDELRKRVSYFNGARGITMNLSKVSDQELIDLKRYAFRRFYFSRPRIIDLYRVYPVKSRLFKNCVNVISEMLFGKWVLQT